LAPSPSVSLAIPIADVPVEIYRIVSSKALDGGDSGQNPLGERRQVVEISKSQDPETKQGCC